MTWYNYKIVLYNRGTSNPLPKGRDGVIVEKITNSSLLEFQLAKRRENMDKVLSPDEIKGRLKPLIELLKQQPEATVNALNESLSEEPIGVNLFYKGVTLWDKQKPRVRIGTSSS